MSINREIPQQYPPTGNLVERVARLFRKSLRDGEWRPVTELQNQIPKDLADARCNMEPDMIVGELSQKDKTDHGRWKLTLDVVQALQDSAECEIRGPDDKKEILLLNPDQFTFDDLEDENTPEPIKEPPTTTPPKSQGEITPTPVEMNRSVPDAAETLPKGGEVEIEIDREFATLLPPPTAEEVRQLESNLVVDKACHDALVIWKGHNILLGGHHRLELCRKHNLPYTVVEVELRDREAARWWIIKDQLGKRNVPLVWSSYWRGALYNAEKQSHGGVRTSKEASSQSENLKTVEALAKQFKVSTATISRDGEFADAINTIAENCGEEAKQAIISGEAKVSRKDVINLADLEPEVLKKEVQELLEPEGQTRGKKQRNQPKAGKKSPTAPPQLAEPTMQPEPMEPRPEPAEPMTPRIHAPSQAQTQGEQEADEPPIEPGAHAGGDERAPAPASLLNLLRTWSAQAESLGDQDAAIQSCLREIEVLPVDQQESLGKQSMAVVALCEPVQAAIESLRQTREDRQRQEQQHQEQQRQQEQPAAEQPAAEQPAAEQPKQQADKRKRVRQKPADGEDR